VNKDKKDKKDTRDKKGNGKKTEEVVYVRKQ
jgi:hypothetical protein